MIGSMLEGKYRTLRQLGAGAMGEVYEAEHMGTGRKVAVKIVTGAISKDPELVGRFQREARAAGMIDTKHITQVLDTGIEQQSSLPFMVMEFLAGEDLQHFLKRSGPISPELALRILAQASFGLMKAHEAEVVHRDIKPANLFLARSDGEIVVKLLDFGIAKVKMDHAKETENAELTRTGNMLGSPLFMSPEQARGTKTIDSRTDIWSLGVSLYQALCGRAPFQHITALGELIIMICSEPPPSVQQFAPWVPPEVAAIVHGCIRQNPDARFQTAKDLLAAVKWLLPYGWAIQEEMLMPLSASARAQVAPLLAMSADPRAARPVSSPSWGPAMAISGVPHPGQAAAPTGNSGVMATSALVQPVAGSPMTQSESGTIGGAAVQSPSGARSAPSSALAAALGIAAGVAILAGGGIFVWMRSPPTPAPIVSVAQPTPPPPPSVAAVSMASAVPSAVPVQDTMLRRVKVVIVPADALAEVEGKITPTKLGILEIEGKPGSVHRVRVRKGNFEKVEDVIVTEGGPSVPKIELSFALAAPKPTSPGLTLPKGIDKRFE